MYPIFDMTWWQLGLLALLLTHITIVAVTIFLHRHQAHRALELSPVLSHFFRFWLWLTTGMVTREWVAIHRKHHARCETKDDPHSPQVLGINRVLWLGVYYYQREAKNQETLEKYGRGTPDDWMERHFYGRFTHMGVVLMLAIDLVLFGFAGLTLWAVQMIWIPFWAAGVINGIGHFWGYRNWNTADASTNIFPWGVLIGGEELHNNHHAFASSARLSNKWYEIDIGWFYIRLLERLGLAKVRKLAPRIKVDASKLVVDRETVRAVLGNRMQVLSNYASQVINPVTKTELCTTVKSCRKKYRIARRLLANSSGLDLAAKDHLQAILKESRVLETVYQYQQKLNALWERTATSQEARLDALQEWILNADQTGIAALERFARSLKGYSLVR